MIICILKYHNKVIKLKLHTSVYTIEQFDKIKALCMYFSSELSNRANIYNIIYKVNLRLSVLREVFRFSNSKKKNIIEYRKLIWESNPSDRREGLNKGDTVRDT